MARVRYEFQATGADSVINAYKGIGRARDEAARAEASYARVRARAPANTEARKAREEEQAATRAAKAADAKAAAEKRANDKRIRDAERTNTALDRLHSQSLQKQYNQAERARERDERAAKTNADRAVRRRQNEAERLARAEHRAIERYRQQMVNQRVTGYQDQASRLAGSVGSIALGVGGAAVAGGVALTGAAARDAYRLDEAARRTAINARQAGGVQVDHKELAREFSLAAIATPGVGSVDIAEAVQEFVGKTGDLASGRKFARTMATVASASGARVQDVASASAALSQKFGIKDEGGIQEALSAIYFQGKAGSFELRDAASQYDKLTAAGARFGLDQGIEGVKTLGGLTQIARSATGSPEQAANAVEATLRQLVSRATEGETNIQKDFGVDVFTDDTHTKTRNVRDILTETISGAKGDLPALQKVFGEEGIRAISPLITAFNQAANATRKGATEAERRAAGEAAIRNALSGAIDATGSYAEVQQDAASAQQSASAQMAGAWEEIVMKLGGEVAPIVAEMAVGLAQNREALDALTGSAKILGEAFAGVARTMGLIKDGTGVADAKTLAAEEAQLAKLDEEVGKAYGTAEGPSDALLKAHDAQMAKVGALRARQQNVAGVEMGQIDAGAAYDPTDPNRLEKFRTNDRVNNVVTAANVLAMNPLGAAVNYAGGAVTNRVAENDYQREVRGADDANSAQEAMRQQMEAAAAQKEAAQALKDAASNLPESMRMRGQPDVLGQ